MSESTTTETTETTETTTDESTNGQDATKDEDPQIDRLRQALTAERKERVKLEAQIEDERRKGLSEHERALAEARAEATREERERWQERLVAAEVRAAAAGRLADPDDARLADLSDVTVDDDGVIDRKGIEHALDTLVKAKPHLAKPTAPPPKAPGGVRTEQPGDSPDAWLRAKIRGGS
jgi:hypothetical protein